MVSELSIEAGRGTELDELSIDASAAEALFAEVFEEIAMFPFLTADERGEGNVVTVGVELLELGDDLIAGLGFDRDVAVWAEAGSDAGEEDPQEILDFGDGADGAAGVIAGRFLADGDRGGETGEEIDIRFGELSDELASVGGEAFEIPSLSFGVERIEGHGAFAAAADAGKTDEFTARER